MKIAYIGDFINHGKFLVPTGTSVVLLLSEIPDVEVIDVYCPILNLEIESFKEPKKIKIIETYSYDDPFSIVNILQVRKKYYDKIIFNIMPTAFGNSNLSNLAGLLIPIVLKTVFRKNNIEVIYHNSVYTSDISKLGYDSYYDKLRSLVLGVIEREIFKFVRTFLFLKRYKDEITRKIGKNQLRVLNGRYLEAMTTAYLNGIYCHEYFMPSRKDHVPIILMHGSWGPQKNIELGFNTLSELRKQGLNFDLIISGGINHHFEEYEQQFNLLLEKYNDILEQYQGFVRESDILNLFAKADLLILPYNTPGGRSAVLEQAIFFEVPTIAIDFPEFREQTEGISFVRLIDSKDSLILITKEILQSKTIRNSKINVNEKLQQAINNIKKLLE